VRHFGVLIVLGLLGLGACGGGGGSTTGSNAAGSKTSPTRTTAASPERTRLESALRASLEAPGSQLAGARDLDECVVQQSSALPLTSLRKLVTAQSDRPVADPLLARCVAQGKGVSWIRGAIAASVAGNLPPSTPPRFSHCMIAGVDRLTPAQLAAALQKGANGDESYSVRLGRRIALGCVQAPGVFDEYRKLFLSGIRATLERRHLPPAFVQCVLNKAGAMSPKTLATLIQGGSAVENAYGQKLGRECRVAPSA
jgi:hypothetical protein